MALRLIVLGILFMPTDGPRGLVCSPGFSRNPSFVFHPKAGQQTAQHKKRPRVRDAGIRIGVLLTGKLNAITDVAGVTVGHETIIEGDDVRTGVTAILPHDGNVFQQKVPAAIVIGNGFGKFVGISQIQELGVLETPIALTNTLSTFMVADAVVKYTLRQKGNEDVRSVNPVVGECNDGSLNNIRLQKVTAQHVENAIRAAKSGPVPEGSVGAGTGTRCLGWKGGIGTSSRVTPETAGGYKVGVLVQTNFGGILTIAGAPVGKELGRYFLKREVDADSSRERGSCIVVVATDAPMDARQLERLAKRALLGLAAVGSPMTHGSGDYVLAFSTHKDVRVAYSTREKQETKPILRDERLSAYFQAVKEATEEAVVNSLFQATTVTGFKGNTSEALPLERVLDVCRKFGVLDND